MNCLVKEADKASDLSIKEKSLKREAEQAVEFCQEQPHRTQLVEATFSRIQAVFAELKRMRSEGVAWMWAKDRRIVEL